MESKEAEDKDVQHLLGRDWMRDSPLRLMGYANELGEALRPLAPRFVGPSYAVAAAYVLADGGWQATRASKRCELLGMSESASTAEVQVTVADTLLWQSLASVVFPGFVINRVVAGASFLLARASASPRGWLTALPTAIGMASIPLIVEPLDEFTHSLLDVTVRPFLADLKASAASGDS
eukprot:PLAT12357.1.p1 GENE.PLAT12357.1~~PLAT12357.1.p1  ORF type:complete len:190 (+),score=16.08 PLAT12357.1:35-571(+)